jgi:hypothetical protein
MGLAPSIGDTVVIQSGMGSTTGLSIRLQKTTGVVKFAGWILAGFLIVPQTQCECFTVTLQFSAPRRATLGSLGLRLLFPLSRAFSCGSLGLVRYHGRFDVGSGLEQCLNIGSN